MQETTPIRAGEEVDPARLSKFLSSSGFSQGGPVVIEQFPAGSSNLTYLVKIGSFEYVLRRPPYGNKVKTAHDMRREFDVLSRLAAVYRPAPRPLLFCEDDSVIGSEFYLMERRRGLIIRGKSPRDLERDQGLQLKVVESFIGNLAALHALNYEAPGLGDLGMPEGYVRRQVEGWTKRYFAAKTDVWPEFEASIKWLNSNIPAESGASLVHNDYKFDNVMFDPADLSRVTAVLDWEMVTIGDPLMDLGTTLGYWMSPEFGDELMNMPFNPRVLMANITRRDLADIYAGASGRDTDNILFYYVFGTFKIGVIAQQIFARFVKGFTRDERFAGFGRFVDSLGRIASSGSRKRKCLTVEEMKFRVEQFLRYSAACFTATVLMCAAVSGQRIVIRVDQAGYLADDPKVVIVASETTLSGQASVRDAANNKELFSTELVEIAADGWGGRMTHHYSADVSRLHEAGRYVIETDGVRSAAFGIGPYPGFHEDLLSFMRQQRCGYNPFLNMVCHQRDGRSFYSPLPDESFVDASGGWHDAGDQLKYLITASNATARMLLAYELEKAKFGDEFDALGREGRNGVPDVLDEAKWGLDWIFKLHPEPDQLYHQVADDRDHRGFKLPDQDNADYGWGPNSYRPVYFADGKPQGLSQWKSRSTGIANIAGRSAAAMAMGYRIWRSDLRDPIYAARCLKAARELYAMGKRQEGFQQGNSFGAPYRYNEITWADDMEFAAAELYRATRESVFLGDAVRYARMAGTTSWMEYDNSSMGEQMSRHYEMYPFTNIGHFALYPLVDAKKKRDLANYYRSGIERIAARGKTNAYGVGVPFLWCSNNLVIAYITQVRLYELMTGDRQFHTSMIAHRDWLLGRNPWGTSMFEGLPANGVAPADTHLPAVQILKRQVVGGLVDGPIATETYRGLIGLTLTHADKFAAVQPDKLVYHDDVGDYATNEPTMDGTADAILVMAMFSKQSTAAALQKSSRSKGIRDEMVDLRFTFDQGGIIRGDKTSNKMALVFTGDEFAEGGTVIADALAKHGIKASFFLTGRFYRTRANRQIIERLKKDGHYLGPHSDEHLLYADWDDRSKTVVTRKQFELDLNANFAAMRPFGIDRKQVPYFLPPFEWYNRDIVDWAGALGYRIINFTPGTRSNADYTTDDDKNYISSEAIMKRIKEYEAKDSNGLNGFILLTHIGSGPKRTDKFYSHLEDLLAWLESKGYTMVRVDELLH